MPKNKQEREAVNKQEVAYAELKGCKSQQKRKVPNTDLINDLPSDQQVCYVELKFPDSSCSQDRKHSLRKKRKVCQTIAGSMSILCVLLMTAVGVMLISLFSSRKEQNQNTTVPTLPSKNMFSSRKEQNQNTTVPILPSKNRCPCYQCLEPWVVFGKSCYLLYNTPKTWKESHAACAELNSHLLKIDTEEELKILSSMLDMSGWIGLTVSESSGLWLWQDGTQVIKELLTFLEREKHCGYVHRNRVYSDLCSYLKGYICECYPHQLD